MMRKYLIALSLALLLATPGGNADDIDIYISPSANATGDSPVVMFTLDYRSNLGSSISSCGFLTTATYDNGNTGGATTPYLTTGCNTFFDYLRGALKYVLEQVGASGSDVRIGLAMSHGNTASCVGPTATNCSNGGYILVAPSSMSTHAARNAFFAKLDAIPTPGGNVAYPYQGKELFYELFRYFGGRTWYNMKNGWDDQLINKDEKGSTHYNLDNSLDYACTTTSSTVCPVTTGPNAAIPLSWATSIVSGSSYISPLSSTATCSKLYTVNILFAVSNQEDDSDTDIKANMTGINLAGTNNKFSTVIRWMYDNDVVPGTPGKQNVISYFIVDPTKNNTTTQEYASAGVGQISGVAPYLLSSDPTVLVDTLKKIFKNILSTSTTFVAPSVAVNVYNRSQVRDEVFIAMFKADSNGLPGWPGNLKKYKVGVDAAGNEQIQDSIQTFAVAADGRVDYDAISYWTIPGDLPAPPADPTTTLVAGKDGRAVDRGGVGSKIPGFKLKCASTTDTLCAPGDYSPGLVNPTGNATNITTRKMFTEPASYTPGTATAMRALNADVATATALQSALAATSVGTCDSTDTDATSACNLLTYARGGAYVNIAGVATLKARSWIMGDLLHSRPIAINYGARSGSSYTVDNPDIRVVTGGNDGVMHMFRNSREGGTPVPNADNYDGVETWGFMPLEVMHEITTFVKNNATSPPHPYTVDGSPAIYQLDWNGNGNIETPDSTGKNDKVLMFFGLRRGGYAYYAVDITNPDDPKMLWKIKRGDVGFEELGQTWSTPKVAMMLYDGSTTSRPVLIIGGGYDPNKDTHYGHGSYTTTGLGTNDSMGNAIYIINAETGALVWKATKGTSTGYSSTTRSYTRTDMLDSIPSDALVVDSDGNGLADRIYVGDTGGVMWRVDIACRNQDGSGTKADGTALCPGGGWQATPLFSVGRHYINDVANDRRFFYPPSYVQTFDTTGNFAYDALSVGTGDRENPKDTLVTNWVYTYKDRDTNSGTITSTLKSHIDFGDVTNNCLQDSPGGSCTPNLTVGWRMKLECPHLFVGTTPPAACGEKLLSPALVLNGKVFVNTYIPSSAAASAGTCGLSEGNGLSYALSLKDASAVEDFLVTNNTTSKTLFKADRYTLLASGGIPAENVSLGGGKYLRPDLNIKKTSVYSGYRTYWYEKYRP